MSVDLTEPIRAAIVGSAPITSLLPTYKGSFNVFTRRPAPHDTGFPVVLISDDISNTDEDGVDDFRPVITRDVSVYGSNGIPGDHRVVAQIAYLLRSLFHRQRLALTVPGWSVTDIVASGPTEASTLDDQVTGRIVELRVRLAALP